MLPGTPPLVLGAGLSGIGGLYYVLDYNQGIWATTGQIEALGWLAVALVIFIHLEALKCDLGCLSFRYAVLALPVPSEYSWNQSGKLCNRPGTDGSLCSNDHCACCSKLP